MHDAFFSILFQISKIWAQLKKNNFYILLFVIPVCYLNVTFREIELKNYYYATIVRIKSL